MLEIIRKVTSADDLGASTMQNRFAHAKFPLRWIPEMIRRDGLSSWSNIRYASGHVELQLGLEICVLFGAKNSR